MAEKLLLPPSEAGYGASLASAFHYANLNGGRGRRRAKFVGGTHYVSVTWVLDEWQYDYWMAFWRISTAEGVLPFLADLIVDNAAIAEYEVGAMPDSLRLSVRGESRVVQLDVEAVPVVDADFDAANLLHYGLYGDDAPDVLARLAVFANEDIPGALAP